MVERRGVGGERKEKGWAQARIEQVERRKRTQRRAGKRKGCGGDCEQWRREGSSGFWRKRKKEEQVARVEKD